ncbi:MAG: L-alanine exporter AlaE [Candidatus Micrarchaeia archaeon]
MQLLSQQPESKKPGNVFLKLPILKKLASKRVAAGKHAAKETPDVQSGVCPAGPSGSSKAYDPVFSAKAWLVDSISRSMFYVPVIGLWEYFVAGMGSSKVLVSRGAAILLNFVIGRVHGKARELACVLTHTGDFSPPGRKKLVETVTGAIVGITSYLAVLGIAGASVIESIIAAPFAFIFTTFSGYYFGKFQDFMRIKFKAVPVFDKETAKPEKASVQANQ